MARRLCGYVLIVTLMGWAGWSARGQSEAPALAQQFSQKVLPILQQHCYGCHANGKSKGQVSLEGLVSLEKVQAGRKVWRSAAEAIEQGLMPPESKPALTAEQVHAIAEWARAAQDLWDSKAKRDPGRVTIRRLNRTEYNNTIRDLVGVDFKPANDFPADDTGYGFDNIADVLSMSPLLAEKYFEAAEQILDRAITDTRPPKPRTARYAGTEFKAEVGFGVDGSAWHLPTNGQITRRHEITAAGDYEIRVQAYQEAFGDEPAKMVLRIEGKDLKTFDVMALKGKPGVYTLRLPLNPGNPKLALAYINNAVDNKNPDPKKRGDRNLIVLHMTIEGPFNAKAPAPSEAHQRIFFVMPEAPVSEDEAARKIVARFATRAFRRPVKDAEVDRLLTLYKQARADGEPFVQAVRVPLSAVLVSPHFLYRVEADPVASPEVRNLNDYEIASRLSYFLWSSMPDEQLLKLAEQGKLRDRMVREKQIQRMMADPKAGELVRNFVGQWLELRNLKSHAVDAQAFPRFDGKLREAMGKEIELFITSMVKEDRSIIELLDADYTYVNERLARHYGIEGVKGEQFVKVKLAGTHRGGVMTMGGVLMLTAMPTRTSPVKRGVFVLEQILGTPPPPPPADVPPLSEKAADVASASVRKRFELHRSDPTCASCHVRMDGMGFALENFDATGQWRERDGKFAVDAVGELPGGRKINGPEGLRQLLVARKADFVRNLAEKLFTYALGRGVEDYDRPAIQEICRQVEKDGYRFSSLVRGIVESDAFLQRRTTVMTAVTPNAATTTRSKP